MIRDFLFGAVSVVALAAAVARPPSPAVAPPPPAVAPWQAPPPAVAPWQAPPPAVAPPGPLRRIGGAVLELADRAVARFL